MPIGWTRKTRRSRFSQFVADNFQLPKRRRSLVVETGFPTSLIDLYVRNRGRFRKSTEKKQRGSDVNSLSSDDSDYRQADEVIDDHVVVDDGIVASEREINAEKHAKMNKSSTTTTNSLVDLNNLVSSSSDFSQKDEIVEDYCKTEAERRVGIVQLNPILVVVLMVVLVLGSKFFTIAITLLLLLFELMGKRLLGRSVFMSRGVNSKQTASLVVCDEGLKIEEHAELEDVRSEGLIEIQGKRSRKAMMKSKIKNLVPKKLRIRKSSMGSKHEISCELKEGERVVCSNECLDSKGKIVETGRRSSSSTLSSDTESNDDELGTDLRQNSDFLVLVLIVLLGLMEGRVFALAIALSWCLMLKLQWRNVTFSIS